MRSISLLIFALMASSPVLAQSPVETDSREPERKEARLEPNIMLQRKAEAYAPLRLEQVCPSFETSGQSNAWNTVEVGLSFPLKDPHAKLRPYSRYTCSRQSPSSPIK